MPHSDLCRPVVLGQVVEKEIELSHSLPEEKREVHICKPSDSTARLRQIQIIDLSKKKHFFPPDSLARSDVEEIAVMREIHSAGCRLKT